MSRPSRAEQAVEIIISPFMATMASSKGLFLPRLLALTGSRAVNHGLSSARVKSYRDRQPFSSLSSSELYGMVTVPAR
jgi:hypothetical protein